MLRMPKNSMQNSKQWNCLETLIGKTKPFRRVLGERGKNYALQPKSIKERLRIEG